MRTIVDALTHDLAVVDALETIPGDHPVGFAAAPDGALADLLNGSGPDYLILYPLPGGTRDGSICDPYADADIVYQVTCVGFTPQGVRWLIGQIELALLDVTVADRYVTQVTPEDLGAVRLDPDVKPTLHGPGVFIATPRYRIFTTPAA